jgi:CBS domain-containing protein
MAGGRRLPAINRFIEVPFMNVSEIMTRKVVTVSPELDLHGLAELFIEKDISGAPVVDKEGKFLGIVREEDLVLRDKKIHLPTLISILNGVFAFGEDRFESEFKKMAALTVEEIMDRNAAVIRPDTLIEDVATMVVEEGKNYFPVLEGKTLAGVVTKKDIVRAIAQNKLA